MVVADTGSAPRRAADSSGRRAICSLQQNGTLINEENKTEGKNGD